MKFQLSPKHVFAAFYCRRTTKAIPFARSSRSDETLFLFMRFLITFPRPRWSQLAPATSNFTPTWVSCAAIRIVGVEIPPLQPPGGFQITRAYAAQPKAKRKIASRKRLTQLRLDALLINCFPFWACAKQHASAHSEIPCRLIFK